MSNMKIHYIVCLLVASACQAQDGLTELDSKLRDFVSMPNPIATRSELIQWGDTSSLIDEAMALHSAAGTSIEGQNRLWRLLAMAPGDSGTASITHTGRISSLEQALVNGDRATKISVLQNVFRIDLALRSDIIAAINASVPVEHDPSVLIALLNASTTSGLMDFSTKEYVEGLAVSLASANAGLIGNLNQQRLLNPESYKYSIEHGVKTAAVSASLAACSDVSDGIGYLASLNTSIKIRLDAMAIVGNSQLLLENEPQQQIELWMSEYVSLLIQAGAADHINRYGLRYIYQLVHEFPNLKTFTAQQLLIIQNAYVVGPESIQLWIDKLEALCSS